MSSSQTHITHFFPGYLRPFQCMLAAKCPFSELGKLRLPLWETPKIDGIRCVTFELPGDRANWYCLPLSRHMKRIPNRWIANAIGENCPPGLDGEIVALEDNEPGETPMIKGYYETSSAVLSFDGQPKFQYLVFDYITPQTRELGYLQRLDQLRKLRLPDFCKILEPTQVKTVEELQELVNRRMDEGFEGSCLRTGCHPYKFGRSSLRQQGLVAVKLFEPSEARVTGCENLQRNRADPEIGPQGFKVRPRRKETLMDDMDYLGKLHGVDTVTKQQVTVGSGFTEAQRREFWLKKDKLNGLVFRYKHQPYGAVEGGKPRSPIFLGFREEGM